MTAPLARSVMLQGRFVFWSGAVTARQHALRAVKLTIPLDGALCLRLPSQPLATRVTAPILVAPLVQQELGCEGSSLSLFLDPDSLPVRRLIASMSSPVMVLDGALAARLAAMAAPLRDPCDDGLTDWSDEVLRALTPPHALAPPWDRRVEAAQRFILAAGGAQRPLAEVAAHVGLSPTRLAHVWRAQIGMPIRAWVLWQRVIAALQCSFQGASIAQAAQQAGFADQPHLTRTWSQMVGRRPGEVMGCGKIVQEWMGQGA